MKSSKCWIDKEYKAYCHDHGPDHYEVIEGSEVPSLDGNVCPVIADLVGEDPVGGVPVHHISYEDQKHSPHVPWKQE